MALVVPLITILVALGISALYVWGVWREITKKYPGITPREFFALHRLQHNPLIMPSSYEFEREAVMNPAAVHDGERTHLFYRAIGSDGVSRIGYASSKDGLNIDEKLPYPVFALEGPDPHLAAARRAYMEKNYPALVASGGSWGGTEDPRAVVIDDRMYLTFSAFQNWNSVRIGMTSIALNDLKKKNWKWSPLTFLSPEGQVQKNWMLFPEKRNGKFGILHSISPKVEVDYREDLSRVGLSEPYIQSTERARADIVDEKTKTWHNRMRGAGAPPIKTKFGWLLFYHAMQENEPNKYKLGAMMLDENDPTKVLARAPYPVLEPDAHYEMNGAKPGIVYACGATAHDDQLTVYYGASDNFVCAARTSLSDFVHKLMNHEHATLRASTS